GRLRQPHLAAALLEWEPHLVKPPVAGDGTPAQEDVRCRCRDGPAKTETEAVISAAKSPGALLLAGQLLQPPGDHAGNETTATSAEATPAVGHILKVGGL